VPATVVLLAGCGGDSPSEADGVGTEFARQAVEVCLAALADKQGWEPFPVADFNPTDPDPSQFAEVSGWLAAEVAPTFEAWLADLEAFSTPLSGQEAWDIVLAPSGTCRVQRSSSSGRERGRHGRLCAATRDLNATQDESVATTEAAGVAECAEAHV